MSDVPLVRILRRVPLPFWVAWAVLLTYLAAGRIVRNFFPFSVFDMYQARAEDISTRILFLNAEGESTRLSNWSHFHCAPTAPDFTRVIDQCGLDFRPIPYVARDQQRYLDAHQHDLAEGEEVRIVARAYWLRDVEGRPLYRDCALAVCQATRSP